MPTEFHDEIVFYKNVTFGETPPEISLGNLTDLSGTGTVTFAAGVLGDGTGSPSLTLKKTNAGTADVRMNVGTTLRGRLRLDASENVALSQHDGNGDALGTLSFSNSTGAATLDTPLTLSKTGAPTLIVSGAPEASATSSLMRLGSAIASGSSSGTFIGANAANGYGGNLLDLQVDGSSKIKATAGGILTAAGGLTVSAGTLTVTGVSVVGLHEHVTVQISNLVGASAKVYGIASPVAGTITKIQSRLGGAALTTGDATITGKIGNTAITNGALTITQSDSAEGDIDTANPTAANTVSVGSNINFTVGGTNDASGAFATLTITFLRSA